MMRRAALAGLAALMSASPGVAAETKLIGKFAGWDAAAGDIGKSRTCYISSLPRKSAGKYKKRGEASITIAHWPVRRRFNEVTVVAGYRYKNKSEVAVLIGGTSDGQRLVRGRQPACPGRRLRHARPRGRRARLFRRL